MNRNERRERYVDDHEYGVLQLDENDDVFDDECEYSVKDGKVGCDIDEHMTWIDEKYNTLICSVNSEDRISQEGEKHANAVVDKHHLKVQHDIREDVICISETERELRKVIVEMKLREEKLTAEIEMKDKLRREAIEVNERMKLIKLKVEKIRTLKEEKDRLAINLEEKECSLSFIEDDLESIATEMDRREAHKHVKHEHKKHEPLMMKPYVPKFSEETFDE